MRTPPDPLFKKGNSVELSMWDYANAKEIAFRATIATGVFIANDKEKILIIPKGKHTPITIKLADIIRVSR